MVNYFHRLMNTIPLLFFLVIGLFSCNGICRMLDDSAVTALPGHPDFLETPLYNGFSADTTLTNAGDDSDFEEEDTLPEDSSAVERAAVDTTIVTPATDTGINTAGSDSALAARLDSARLAEINVRPSWLYPGISLEQDTLARRMLHYFYEFNWANIDKTAKKLQRLEKKDHLPPLSYLLLVGMRILRIQKGEYEDDHAKKALLRDLDKLARKGLELAGPSEKISDSLAIMNKFISGGIKGFVATLEIDVNPVKAAMDGFAAQKLLQEVAQQDTAIKDAYLGLGLFNCMLAKAPFIVRGALSITGNEVSLLKGIFFLRTAAYHGRYTTDIARMFLIEFLSPFMGDETEEKRKLLRSLQKKYPENPYFVFLELDENICFHPEEVFVFSSTGRVKKQIARFKPSDYSAKRYANLVKWQYLLANPFPAAGFAPDTAFNLRGFAYYPVFLKAFKEKNLYEKETPLNKRDRERRLHFIREECARAGRIIETSSTMPQGLKNYYLWHVRDGLKVRSESRK